MQHPGRDSLPGSRRGPAATEKFDAIDRVRGGRPACPPTRCATICRSAWWRLMAGPRTATARSRSAVSRVRFIRGALALGFTLRDAGELVEMGQRANCRVPRARTLLDQRLAEQGRQLDAALRLHLGACSGRWPTGSGVPMACPTATPCVASSRGSRRSRLRPRDATASLARRRSEDELPPGQTHELWNSEPSSDPAAGHIALARAWTAKRVRHSPGRRTASSTGTDWTGSPGTGRR